MSFKPGVHFYNFIDKHSIIRFEILYVDAINLIVFFQNNPELVLKLLDKFAAQIYFRENFNDFKCKIRVMMVSWLFLQKQELRISDHHDDFIVKER